MYPKVGDIVAFFPEKEGDNNGASVCPAIITRVWSEVCVNLKVFYDYEPVGTKTSVVRNLTALERWAPLKQNSIK